MARGLPSMTALLGLLAVAGFQNRDKLGELFGNMTRGTSTPGGTSGSAEASSGGLGGMLGGLAGAGGLGGLLGGLGGSAQGSSVNDGLGSLLDRFKQNGHGDTAESWVRSGPNSGIDENQLAEAIGPDVLGDLETKTGLSRQELLSRLSRELPNAIDQLTPDGRMPDTDGAQR